jgi:hypothetical protein
MSPIPQKPASVVLLLRLSPLAFHTMVAVSYKLFSVPFKYFGRNTRRKNGRESQRMKVDGTIVALAKRKQGGEDDSCRTDAPQLR